MRNGTAYAREAVGTSQKGKVWFVKLAHPTPFRRKLLPDEKMRTILVVEDGEPVMETQLRVIAQQHNLPVQFFGKVGDGLLKLYGELTTDKVVTAMANILGISIEKDTSRQAAKEAANAIVAPRSSTLCAGCPHLGTYWAMKKALRPGKESVPVINGDIGCYEQAGYGVKGQMPQATDEASARYLSRLPYDFLDTLHVMGSGLSLAQGEARAGVENGQYWAVSGDSTFFHSSMPSLVNAVWNGTKITFVVMDNSWTSMTGHQVCPATGLNPRNQTTKSFLLRMLHAFVCGTCRSVDPRSQTTMMHLNAGCFDVPLWVLPGVMCIAMVRGRERQCPYIGTTIAMGVKLYTAGCPQSPLAIIELILILYYV